MTSGLSTVTRQQEDRNELVKVHNELGQFLAGVIAVPTFGTMSFMAAASGQNIIDAAPTIICGGTLAAVGLRALAATVMLGMGTQDNLSLKEIFAKPLKTYAIVGATAATIGWSIGDQTPQPVTQPLAQTTPYQSDVNNMSEGYTIGGYR